MTGGSYDWTVPNNPTTDAYVKIFANAVAQLSDTGDGAFAIAGPVLLVTSPNGDEVLHNGSPVTLTWEERNFYGPVTIRLSTNGGINWQTVAAGVTGGSYLWTVAAADTSNAVLEIRSDAVPGLSDQSDGPFTINSGSNLTVTAPNGGEILTPGTNIPVTWNSSGFAGNVHIEYTTDGGASWSDTVDATGNDGSYQWYIQSLGGGNGLVRITSLDDPGIQDTSDAPFTILTASLTLGRPATAAGEPATCQSRKSCAFVYRSKNVILDNKCGVST